MSWPASEVFGERKPASGNGMSEATVGGSGPIEHLDRLEARQEQLIRDIEASATPDARQRKPSPEEWSLTEVVQHLALVSEAMLRSGRVRSQESPSPEHDGFRRLESALASATKRKAPTDRIVPRPGVTWDDAVARSRGGVDRWREALASGRLVNMVFPHPLAGELTLEQTLRFLALHLDHHLAQVNRLLGRDAGAGTGGSGGR